MNKILLFAGILLTCNAIAQTFSDNFDSYTAGQYLGTQSAGVWTTWNNAPGTSEDVYVSNANSQSGANSLYFSSNTQGGGPTDLVKLFGGSVLNTGQFSFQFNLFVETGKAAYFNLQRSLPSVWDHVLDCYFHDNGKIIISKPEQPFIIASYTQNQWFNFRIDVDLNKNRWEVFINNNSIGSFSHPQNGLAAIDIFPSDLFGPTYSAGYFIDDFQYTITPYTLPAINAAVLSVKYDQGKLSGSVVTPKVKIRNLGTTTINSFDLDITYNGNTISQSVTSLSLASLASTTITLTGTHTLVNGNNNMIVTVSNVNGNTTDGDALDDVLTLPVNPVIPAVGRMVVGEEVTGTWCQWCPRGAVFMEKLETLYPQYWAGIAVHNDTDPMTVAAYDDGVISLIGVGSPIPSILVDRTITQDPLYVEEGFLTRLATTPKAVITNGAIWNATTRELKVSVSAQFAAAATNAYKLAVVLTEDNVTGTASGYAQINAYSGGAAGPMGGYESLADPVPAATMVYDHVARVIAPSFTGYANSFPATVNTGETHTINASFILPATWDENDINIIGLLIAPDGKIDNAGKATRSQAVTNGFVPGTPTTASIDETNQIDATLTIYPNPASDYATIAVTLPNESNVSVRIFDLSGKEVASRSYSSMNGATTINVNTANFRSGVYVVEMTLVNTVVQRRLVIE